MLPKQPLIEDIFHPMLIIPRAPIYQDYIGMNYQKWAICEHDFQFFITMCHQANLLAPTLIF